MTSMVGHSSSSTDPHRTAMPALVPLYEFSHLPLVPIRSVVSQIGSRETVNIRLRSRSVSALHALLLFTDDRFVIRDLASRTHVYVNGQLAVEQSLNAGDEIKIGRISFRLDMPPVSNPAGDNRAPAPAARLWRADGSVVPLTGITTVIGRRRGVEIVVPGPDVARAHAVLFPKDGQWFLVHLGNRPAPLMDDRPVVKALLQDGDVFRIGAERFQIELAARCARSPDGSAAEAKDTRWLVPNLAPARAMTSPAAEPVTAEESVAESDCELTAPLGSAPTPTLDAASSEVAKPPATNTGFSTCTVVPAVASSVQTVRTPTAPQAEALVTTELSLDAESRAVPEEAPLPRPSQPAEWPRVSASSEARDVPGPASEPPVDARVPSSAEPAEPERAPPVQAAPIPTLQSPGRTPLTKLPADLRGWGPLALALAATSQPELLAQLPAKVTLADKPNRPARRRRLVAFGISLFIVTGAAVTWVCTRFIK